MLSFYVIYRLPALRFLASTVSNKWLSLQACLLERDLDIHKMTTICGNFEDGDHVNQYQVFRPVYTSNVYEKIMDYLYLKVRVR